MLRTCTAEAYGLQREFRTKTLQTKIPVSLSAPYASTLHIQSVVILILFIFFLCDLILRINPPPLCHQCHY